MATKWDLHYIAPKDVVEVHLTHAANVFLLDSVNLQSWQVGRQFTYYGGYYRQSPVLLSPPRSGTWYLIVDPGPGYSTRASVIVHNN